MMEQKLTLEEAVKKYDLTKEQIFDHAAKGDLDIYYEHPELGGPFQVRNDFVHTLEKVGYIYFLDGFSPVNPKYPLSKFALYSPQESHMFKDYDYFKRVNTIFIKDVYLLESEVKLLANSQDKRVRKKALMPEMEMYAQELRDRGDVIEVIAAKLVRKFGRDIASGHTVENILNKSSKATYDSRARAGNRKIAKGRELIEAK